MIKLPYLPESREIFYVSKDNPFIIAAEQTAKNFSSDYMQSTGAVIVKDGFIVGEGANQSFLKHPALQNLHRRGLCIRKFLKIKSGTKYWLCLGCSGHKSHAEARAVLNARTKGIDVSLADLYLWGHWWCCKSCWDIIIKAGIKNVYLLEGSEKFFNFNSPEHILGKRSDNEQV